MYKHPLGDNGCERMAHMMYVFICLAAERKRREQQAEAPAAQPAAAYPPYGVPPPVRPLTPVFACFFVVSAFAVVTLLAKAYVVRICI